MKFLHFSILILTTTSLGNARNCDPARWFKCDDGTCVSKTWKCDGEADCTDGSDERDCPITPKINPRLVLGGDSLNLGFKPCNDTTEFRCNSHDLCVPLFWVCDGRADCTDRSDENPTFCQEFKKKHHCGDSEEMFFCHDDANSCIAKRWTCNGEVDCPNGFDEKVELCNRTTTLPIASSNDCSQGFKCQGSNAFCLTWGQVCNNVADCPNGDDENPETCSQACQPSLNCTDRQICQPTPDGVGKCLCKNGYFEVEESVCEDINECELTPPPCSQECINGHGNYFCKCEDGYSLTGGDCRVDRTHENTQLLFSSDKEIRIKNFPNDDYDLVAGHSNDYLRQAIGVSFDPVEQRVYWADIVLKKIVSSTLDGSRFQTWNHSQIEKPEFLAIDYLGRNIYYSDSKQKHIGVCTIYFGHFCRGIITSGVTNPRGIAVYPKKGLLAYSNWDDDVDNHPHIGLSGMDGQGLKILVNTSIKWPNGVAFDMPSNRVFWVDAFFDLLESVRLDGSHRVSVKPSLPFMSLHPFSVSVFEETIYWTDSGMKEVQSCHKFSGDNHTVVIKSAHIKPNAVQIINQALFPSGPSPCLALRCSQLCLIKEGGDEGVCQCGSLYKLVDNNRCELNETVDKVIDNAFLPRNAFDFKLENQTSNAVIMNRTSTSAIDTSTTTTSTPTSHMTTNEVHPIEEEEIRREIIITSEITAEEPYDNTVQVVLGVIIAIICLIAAVVLAYVCWKKKYEAGVNDNGTSARTGSQVFFKNPSFGLDQNSLKDGQYTKVDEELKTIEVVGPVRSKSGTAKEVFNYSIGSGEDYEELDFNPSRPTSETSRNELMVDVNEVAINEDNDRYQLLD